MNKLITPLLGLTVVGLIALLFYVKADSKAQAKDFVKEKLAPVNAKLIQDKEIKANNRVLWELAFDAALTKPDRKTFVKNAKKIETGKDSKFSVSSLKDTKHWRVSHSFGSFEIRFSKSGSFESINIEELLGEAD